MSAEAENLDRLVELEKRVKELEAENAQLKTKLADGPAAVEISCPACESKVTSDGKKLVKKNREFAALEVLADETQVLRQRNSELETENKALKGGNSGNSPARQRSRGFAVTSR